jgi:hypothetical protein
MPAPAGINLQGAQRAAARRNKLSNFLKTSINTIVRGLRTLLTVLLLANWFACTAHCQLEKIGFFHEADCHGAAIQSDSESNGHDDSRICDWMTSGGLQAADVRVIAPEALAVVLAPLFANDSCDERLALNSGGVVAWSVTPPELVHTFQFVLRTALPARAPSLAS